MIGDLLGKWARYLVIAVISVSLFGTCVAQIVASSADAYYYSEEIDKRSVTSTLVRVICFRADSLP